MFLPLTATARLFLAFFADFLLYTMCKEKYLRLSKKQSGYSEFGHFGGLTGLCQSTVVAIKGSGKDKEIDPAHKKCPRASIRGRISNNSRRRMRQSAIGRWYTARQAVFFNPLRAVFLKWSA